MRPETIYLAVVTNCDKPSMARKPYIVICNRVYQVVEECIREAERYTRENSGTIAVILSFTIERGLNVEASYVAGHPNTRHAIGVRDCQSVYLPCVLGPIVSYLDTICRVNEEEEGHNG